MLIVHLYIFLLLNVSLFISCWPDFHLYTQRNPTSYERVEDTSKSVFFVESVETKFLIHGFGDNGLTTDLIDSKNQILLKENINVIIVDWKDGASMPNYLNAAANTQIVGSKVGLFLITNKIDPKKVHCIGHSLGAHTCGFAGKVKKMRRISGLDPAGPIFRGRDPSLRLDKSDADFVDVIHVDSFYGIQDAIGHKDYYPSGGKSQPGCGVSGFFPWGKTYSVNYIEKNDIQAKLDPVEIVACSHVKVPFYYSESINSNCKFSAVLCNDYDDFKKNKCICNPSSNSNNCTVMGYHADNDQKMGIYFLEVNKELPFCKF